MTEPRPDKNPFVNPEQLLKTQKALNFLDGVLENVKKGQTNFFVFFQELCIWLKQEGHTHVDISEMQKAAWAAHIYINDFTDPKRSETIGVRVDKEGLKTEVVMQIAKLL